MGAAMKLGFQISIPDMLYVAMQGRDSFACVQVSYAVSEESTRSGHLNELFESVCSEHQGKGGERTRLRLFILIDSNKRRSIILSHHQCQGVEGHFAVNRARSAFQGRIVSLPLLPVEQSG